MKAIQLLIQKCMFLIHHFITKSLIFFQGFEYVVVYDSLSAFYDLATLNADLAYQYLL